MTQWKEPDPEQEKELRELLNAVARETFVRYDWKSDAGRAFIKRVRELQFEKVSTVQIANALGINHGSLGSVIAYWERPATASRPKKGRQTRPLKRREGGR